MEGNLADSLRPKSRQGATGGDMDVAKFTMSSRPMTSQGNREDDNGDFIQERRDISGDLNVAEIIYYTSDFLISNISDNPKIQKLPPLKFDQKSLQLPGHNGKESTSIVRLWVKHIWFAQLRMPNIIECNFFLLFLPYQEYDFTYSKAPSHDMLSIEFQIVCTCSESGLLYLNGLFIYWSKAQIQPLECTGVSHSTHRLFELT